MKLTVHPLNGQAKGRRLVILSDSELELHRDKIDTDEHWQRAGFIQVVAKKLGIQSGELNGLDNRIVEAAKEADARKVCENPTHHEMECLTSAALDKGDFSIRYLIDEVLPEAQGGLVSGRFKTLKTTVGIDLMASLATGKPFLGRFAVPVAMRAGIVSTEAGKGTLQEIGRRVARSKGLELVDIDGLVWSTTLVQIPYHLGDIEKFIVDNELRAIFLDPTYLMFGAVGDSAANVFKMGSVLQQVTSVIQSTGCSVVICNHNTKGRAKDIGRFDPPELAEVSMSGFAEWTRFWLLLGPRKVWNETTGQHWLWLSTGGSAGHAGLWALDITEGKRSGPDSRIWEVVVANGRDAMQEQRRQNEQVRAKKLEAKQEEHCRRLRQALDRFKQGETSNVLRNTAGLSGSDFGPAIQALLSRGEAEHCQVQKRHQTFDGFRPKQ